MKFRYSDVLPTLMLLSITLVVIFQLVFGPPTTQNFILAFFKFSGTALMAGALYAISHKASGKFIRYLGLSGCLLLTVYLILIFI